MSPLPAPYILDLSVLIAYARFDIQIAELVQILDARQQPLVVPALTLAGAATGLYSGQEVPEKVHIVTVGGPAPVTHHLGALAGLAVPGRWWREHGCSPPAP